MEPATACQTDPSALLANDCASFINACTISKDDPVNKEMSTRQTKTRLSQEAGEAASTNRKTHQLANNSKPNSTVKRRGR
jgi:hypothetical protein